MLNRSRKRLDAALVNLRDITANPASPAQAFQAPIQAVWQAAGADPEGANYAFQALVPLLDIPHAGRAAYIALCCGGLVEQGAQPALGIAPLLSRLRAILADCEAFAAACADLCAREGGDCADTAEIVEAYGPGAAEAFPALAQAWSALDLFGRAGVALLSRSREGRASARSDAPLWQAIQRLAEAHTWAGWLHALLRVLDDEDLLVLHPALERGYRVRISGITDNFQLHLLLADSLLGNQADGWLPGERPPAHTVAIMRGLAEGAGDESAYGVFNMVGWRGLRADGTLAVGVDGSEHWIWGEGVPADIEPFEGVRVVLLGDAPYRRAWNAQRTFSGLVADVQVLEQLDLATVRSWLRMMTQ